MSKKLYTNEQILNFHKKYLSDNPSMAIFCKKENLSYHSLRKGFIRLNLPIIPLEFAKRKFPVNDNFFEKIDTEEKAYILGFIYADGCNHELSHRLEISLAEQDEDILVRISKTLLYGNINVKKYKKRKNSQQNKIGLYIVSRKISKDLKLHGCPARKTFILKFPTLTDNLRQHFIRGYFEGDGMLKIYKRKHNNYQEANFSIVSTKEMLIEISKQFIELGVNSTINKRHKNRLNNNFTLRVSGNQQIKKVCDFLYNNSTIFSKRKHETYSYLTSIKVKKYQKSHL